MSAPPMEQLFCEEHWSELVPRIEDGEINGIALQPLALQALWSHEDVLESIEENADPRLVAMERVPICCFLDDRSRYADATEDWETDYEMLVHMGTLPETPPDGWWAHGSED